MRHWLRAFAGVALVTLVAALGILANFGLLRLTSDEQDPVGRLSPRSLVAQRTQGTATIPATTEHDGDDGSTARLDRDD
jgi:hypothetical protein